MKRKDFNQSLGKCQQAVKDLGLEVVYTHNLDPFFKGDLDGKRIFIGVHLAPEEKLFNLVHLAGHSVQWNVSELLRNLGSALYVHPDKKLLKELQKYEWQANCYGLAILHMAGVVDLDEWLTEKYITDMFYLTHFYLTGKKLKRITRLAKSYPFKRRLKPMAIPEFTPKAHHRTRNGLVISF